MEPFEAKKLPWAQITRERSETYQHCYHCPDHSQRGPHPLATGIVELLCLARSQ